MHLDRVESYCFYYFSSVKQYTRFKYFINEKKMFRWVEQALFFFPLSKTMYARLFCETQCYEYSYESNVFSTIKKFSVMPMLIIRESWLTGSSLSNVSCSLVSLVWLKIILQI